MYLAQIALVFVTMLVGMVASVELGRWLGARQRATHLDAGDSGVGAMDGAVFALFGLLVAFTFSGASTRFDHRRDLMVADAASIRTAYMRIDLLPIDTQPELRQLYRRYVESRIAVQRIAANRDAADVRAVMAEYDRSVALQGQIWNASVVAAQRGSPPALGLVISSVNDMISITTARIEAARMHAPTPIMALLFGLAFLSALLAGRNMAASPRRSWLNQVVFSFVIAGSIYAILDYEFPRLGIIRVDAADRLLVEVLQSMR